MSTPAELAALFHRQDKQAVLAITGGGSRAIAELLEVPGGSRSVLEATVPYSAASLVDWLGGKPDQFCAQSTARAMAMAAFQRALSLGRTADDPFCGHLLGVGCTASLASNRPKRGAHRIHVGLQTATQTATWSLLLASKERSRAQEEAIAAALVLNALAAGAGLSDRIDLPLIEGEQVVEQATTAAGALQELLVGLCDLAQAGHGQIAQAATPPGVPRALFPGAFNPLHVGHRKMAEVAFGRLACPVEFEISIINVDKPPLDYQEIAERTAQFSLLEERLWLSRAATFVEKSRLFPQATFIVGLDTIVRIGEPRYYAGEDEACQRAIEQIAAQGCRFLVFGRVRDRRFQTLPDVVLPPALARLCVQVPPEQFREDISSTEIRNQAEAGELVSHGFDLEAKA